MTYFVIWHYEKLKLYLPGGAGVAVGGGLPSNLNGRRNTERHIITCVSSERYKVRRRKADRDRGQRQRVW